VLSSASRPATTTPKVPVSQFLRIAEHARPSIRLIVDGQAVTALAGDTVLTALLLAGRRVRAGEFGDGPRAGLCLMGACQDCWVALADGRRVRACTTPAEDGMELVTR